MFTRKSFCFILFAALLSISTLCAGDSATYVDLGFSPDGRVYFFGQYGIQAVTLRPWAELYGVDVFQNNFVSGGRLSYTHNSPAVPGQNGSGALFQLINRNSALINRYRLDFLQQGQSLYLDMDDLRQEEPTALSMAAINFRDFEQSASYTATLSADISGSGRNLQSSFSINLERTARDGARKRYTVGNPQIKRSQIASYMIRRVIISPRKDSLIFVIEMRLPGDSGYDIRYMIETVGL